MVEIFKSQKHKAHVQPSIGWDIFHFHLRFSNVLSLYSVTFQKWIRVGVGEHKTREEKQQTKFYLEDAIMKPKLHLLKNYTYLERF